MKPDTDLLPTIEAANYIGFHANTLRNVRHVRHLAGVEVPPYIKLGRVCRYRRSDLDAWLSQFGKQTSTGELTSRPRQ